MACDAETFVSDARCLAAGMSDRQLLAYIAYQSAVNAGESPTPANMASVARCLMYLGERQLLAAIAYYACSGSGGGGVNDSRVTDDGGVRVTDDGSIRVVSV